MRHGQSGLSCTIKRCTITILSTLAQVRLHMSYRCLLTQHLSKRSLGRRVPSPEEIAKGPPDVYTRHISALKIQTCVARRRSARNRVWRQRGAKMMKTNGGGAAQSWVECFDPVSCRLYYWKCGAIIESTEIAWDTPPEELVDLRRRIIRSVDPQSGRFYYPLHRLVKTRGHGIFPTHFILVESLE